MMKRSAWLTASLLLLPACDLSVEPPDRTTWEATLNAGPSFPGVEGQAAALADANGTAASIALSGFPVADTLEWRLREGSCEAPGSVVGPAAAYPPLEIASSGAGTADVALGARIRSGTAYHAAALTSGAAEVVACGDLVEQ